MSLFVTFEGIEGSGTTSQLRVLREYLQAAGHRVYATREPGGTRIGERVRSLLLDPAHSEMEPATEILLFSAARAQLVRQEILPRLAQGEIVLSDRYADSTLAYQGHGLGLDMSVLRAITAFATDNLVPDLTICLDVPVEIGLARKKGQSPEEWNRMEQKELEYFERVRSGYLKLARSEPGRWRILDATLPFEDVQARIRQEIEPLLSKSDKAPRESEEET